MFEIHGNTEGIRDTDLNRLKSLYLEEIDSTVFIPSELAETLAEITARINRELAVYISRSGELLDIIVGDSGTVSLPEYRLRRKQDALCKVRVIHTHPSGSAKLSELDLTALSSLRLDAICAIGVDTSGQINGVSAAFLSAWDHSCPVIDETEIYPMSRLQRLNWMQRIEECDAAFSETHEEVSDAQERALLVAIRDDASFKELDSLVRTAGAIPVGQLIQKRPSPDGAAYIGSGKIKELALQAQTLNADLIVTQDELTGVQIHNLEMMTGTRVIDRTTLILDIFAQRARTREGQLQVSLAQLSYQMTHLVGYGLSLSRLGGGIGTRGPGETKLEMDRRAIRRRRTQLKEQLENLKRQRAIQKKQRARNEIPTVALVGYTNAGKSSIFNRISDAEVYVQNQLFATLDATTRKITDDHGNAFLLTDTVGFISNLPTELIEAFQSTLEEATGADLLLIVSDASNPEALRQRKVVDETLTHLHAQSKPVLEVLNKCDIALPENLDTFPEAVHISALTGEGITDLLQEIGKRVGNEYRQVRFGIPYALMPVLSELHDLGKNVETDYQADMVIARAEIDTRSLQRLLKSGGPSLRYELIDPD